MALFKKQAAGKPGEWFYCLKHKKVEEGPECPAKDRLGPYATAEEARHAIDRVAERNQEWDEDPRWNDDSPREGRSEGTRRSEGTGSSDG